jgi:hypothetical protein
MKQLKELENNMDPFTHNLVTDTSNTWTIAKPHYNDTIVVGDYIFDPQTNINNIETVRVCQLISSCVLGFTHGSEFIEKHNLQRHFKAKP